MRRTTGKGARGRLCEELARALWAFPSTESDLASETVSSDGQYKERQPSNASARALRVVCNGAMRR